MKFLWRWRLIWRRRSLKERWAAVLMAAHFLFFLLFFLFFLFFLCFFFSHHSASLLFPLISLLVSLRFSMLRYHSFLLFVCCFHFFLCLIVLFQKKKRMKLSYRRTVPIKTAKEFEILNCMDFSSHRFTLFMIMILAEVFQPHIQ